ncbi:MAG: histidine kinase [Lachnospiraceae bacterium]|nr:histidine kinase [Lachnospiraceae bacterium]
MEIIESMGVPVFVEILFEICFELVLLVIIFSMIVEINEDKKNSFIRKISIPFTREILIFYVAIVLYNFSNIISVCGVSYSGSFWTFLRKVGVFIYYLVGAFLTVFFLQVIKIDVVILVGKSLYAKWCTFFQLLHVPLIIMLFLTPFTGLLYYIDENKEYYRCIGYYIWQFVTLLSFLYIGFIIVANWKEISRFFRKVIAVCVVFPVIAFVSGLYDLTLDLNNIAIMISALIVFVLYENNKTAYAVELLKEMDAVQVKLMLSQIKPHFLYNTLNTIIYYADKDSDKTKTALVDFSQYLRKNIDSVEEKGLVGFSDELNHTKKYLSLEKLRFEDDLSVEYDIQDEMFVLPVLTLQPLVENAVKHGIRKNDCLCGKITITTRMTETHHEVRIIDDGVGFDVDSIDNTEATHIGIDNVRKRLMLECNGELIIDSTPGEGTVCKILIPVER